MNEAGRELLKDDIDRLGAISPFGAIDPTVLSALLVEAPLVFFKRGEIIEDPDRGEAGRRLWLIRQGECSVLRAPGDPLAAQPDNTKLGAGALFPMECALAERRPQRTHVAAQDLFVWRIEGAGLERLLAEPSFLRWLAASWEASSRDWQEIAERAARTQQLSDQALALPVRTAGSDAAICVMPATSVREAAQLMSANKIGSVVVGSGEKIEGILTQTDLVRRALAEELAGSTPISAIMTTNPGTINDSTTVLEAGLKMAECGYRHLLMTDSEGHLSGVVSERDLFRVQQRGVAHIFQAIGQAASVEEMAGLAGQVRDLTSRVFQQGMEVGQFTRLLSSLNDHIAARLTDLVYGVPDGYRFCWLSFGSEGREEQGFVTDQDNGLIFVPDRPGACEAVRKECLSRAKKMNDALHACGFDLCKGNIMAGNPEWCLTLEEWKNKFSGWIAATTPAAVLNATIFFDFRPLCGDDSLAEGLRDHLFEAVKGQSIFLHLLAKNALEAQPPVGRLSRFATAGGEHKGTIDLKTQGTRLFVDTARIYALAHGVRATNTEQRLRIAGRHMKRAPTAIEGDVAAFRFILRQRILRQLQSTTDRGDANRIDPYLVNEVDQRTLRESFRQAQSLQDRLRLDYER